MLMTHTCNKCLTAILLKQGYRYNKLRKAFSKFYRQHNELVAKFYVGLESLLQQGLSEPEFYGDLEYKFKKIRGMTEFFWLGSEDDILCYNHIGFNLNLMQYDSLHAQLLTQSQLIALLHSFKFKCTPVDRASDSMIAPT